jgi:hypothetical protein
MVNTFAQLFQTMIVPQLKDIPTAELVEIRAYLDEALDAELADRHARENTVNGSATELRVDE